MDLNKIREDLKSLPEEQEKAILSIIQQKIDDDMREVINHINHMESKLESKIKTVYWVIGIATAFATAIISAVLAIAFK